MPYCPTCGGYHDEEAAFCPFCGGPVGDTPREPRYTGFWRRVGATLMDSLIVGLPLSVVVNILGGDGLHTTRTTNAAGHQVAHFHIHGGRFVAVTLVQFLVSGGYAALMQSSASQATVGQMAVGAQVTNLEGRRIGLGRAALRYVVYVLSAATLGIGYLMMLWTRRRQALHDLAAGTLVVMKES